MQKQLFSFINLCFLLSTLSLPTFYFAPTAQAKLLVCNDTGKQRDFALGYKNKGEWTSEGWWKLDDGDCVTPIKGDLKSRFFYYRAKHQGGDFEGESYSFCTRPEPFAIIGDGDCKARGFAVEDFRQLELAKGTLGFKLVLDDNTIYSSGKKVEQKSEQTQTPNPQSAQNNLTGPDAPVGTHGEPYSITATLDGCDYVDGLLWCTFLADGWRYVVKDDGKSHSYILEGIDNATIGGEYFVSGDLMFGSNGEAEITVRSFEPAQSSSKPSGGPAPGTYGEPYTVTGIFRGCVSDEGLEYCLFLADGWRYAVLFDDKTEQNILDQLRTLPVNHRYVIKGDITNIGDITAEVTLRMLEAVGDTKDQQLMNQLTGLWRSKQDPSSKLEFTSDFKSFDYFNGDLSSEGKVSFTKQCDDLQVQRSDELLIQINGPDGPEDVLCYAIVENTNDVLVLMYLPRGNFLEYEKDLGLN